MGVLGLQGHLDKSPRVYLELRRVHRPFLWCAGQPMPRKLYLVRPSKTLQHRQPCSLQWQIKKCLDMATFMSPLVPRCIPRIRIVHGYSPSDGPDSPCRGDITACPTATDISYPAYRPSPSVCQHSQQPALLAAPPSALHCRPPRSAPSRLVSSSRRAAGHARSAG